MKKEDFIKLGLEEEIAKKCETAWAEGLKEFVPKYRFDEVNTEKKALQDTVKERDGQLETLKNSAGDVEGLKKQITDLQATNTQKDKAHAEEIKNLKIDTAVEMALSGAKAKNAKAVKALLDLAKAELDEDGSVKGLADQIKKLQGAEDSKFLFDTETKKTTFKGAKPAETGVETPDGEVDLTKMTYEEMVAYQLEHPDFQF
jgi:Phage minor structural protein GP20.